MKRIAARSDFSLTLLFLGDRIFLTVNAQSLNALQIYMFENGSRHSAVRTIKNFLNRCPRVSIDNLKSDDVFDAETQKALIEFQQYKRLAPTGKMDLKTWIAVGSEMDPVSVNVVSMSDANVRALLQLGQRSKFPVRRNAASLSGAVVQSASLTSALSNNRSFTYRVFVSAFAPFDYFGPLGWSKGDGANRRFGLNPRASYRLQATSTITPSPTGDNEPWSVTKVSDSTTSYLWKPWKLLNPLNSGKALINKQPFGETLYDTEKSEGYLNDAQEEFRPSGVHSESDSARYHLYGNDDAFALYGDNSLFTSDIDIHPSINFSYNTDDPKIILMHATGKIIGDQFPAVEAFILDRNNNGVMLGVFQVRAGDGPVLTREGYRGIIGDKQLPMIDINVTTVVEKGIFRGVIKNGREISLAEHNQQYTNLPTIRGSLPVAPPQIIRPSTHY